jgi:hypothetical protein
MASSQPYMTTDTKVIPAEIGGDRFVAEVVLELWSRTKRARRVGGVLWLDDDHIHDVVDAVRVLGRRGGDADRFGWTGRVFPLRELVKLGATIGPDSASLGSVVYDIEYGVLLEADERVPVEERVTFNPPRPATGGLVMSRPITGASAIGTPITSYGTSPGRYNASGSETLSGERRAPSGTHRRVD